ncbi:MAG: hypothetical protein KR126chlam4_00623 [Candidatus Anoxychlamydiales bacterium]|nr:hypothetical protein [Candidatus Anoxychlamydiales bacterium]
MSSAPFRVSTNAFKLDFTNAGFVRGNQESKHFHLVEKFFKGQAKTLEKLRKQEDRICEIFKYDGNPVGLIVYKKENQSDDSLKIENSLAVISLIVFDGATKEEAFRTCLLKRLGKVAEKNKVSSIHMKVDESDESLNKLLADHGFVIIESSKGEKRNKHVLKRSLLKTSSSAEPAIKRKRAVVEAEEMDKKV